MKVLPALTLGAALIASAATAADEPEPVDAATHVAIVQTITDVAAGADRHDWDRVRDAMAVEITTDYTSLFGGAPTSQASADLVKGWAGFLPSFDSTHHMVANHTVTHLDGEAAKAEADFTAAHRLDDELWVLGGRYSYELRKSDGRWRVSAMTMTALWETGDRDGLIKKALARLADQAK